MSLDIYLYTDAEYVWSSNITHNLNEIADKVGVYSFIWRPEEVGIKYARDNIVNLRQALSKFYGEYDELSKLNLENGWGNIDDLINFTKDYLDACVEYPDATIEVSR